MIRFVLALSCFALLLRIAWIFEPLSAPVTTSDNAPIRRCAEPGFAVKFDPLTRQIIVPKDSTLISEKLLFANPPEGVVEGIYVKEFQSPGCRWLLGYIPRVASHAEIRRFAVGLRHQSLPVIVVSELTYPIFNLRTGVVARAGFLRFPSVWEFINSPRLLVSYGIVPTDSTTLLLPD